MKLILLFLLIVAAFANIWSDCSKPDDDFKISNVVITPDPPVKGQPVTADIQGNLNKTITGGTAHLTISYNGIKLLDETKNICELTTCPIDSNPNADFKYTATIPSSIPSGNYTGQIVLTDQDSDEIGCVSFALNL
ncbi:phosphatidylglycerol/phosphatidylinositol transfer protein [Anaeramoeba ignava]|uniref:Phosphatidylglycerol/phosphatidylinositol transfer protein n=1 Tax=Anaeramoeba ignava TaxID=1746090 RepID=A0A9Q0LG60_ANAIG|nr:phosphatidylglycerol/phosphatidylinositol transfer protein [Anaeramoeba ignava]